MTIVNPAACRAPSSSAKTALSIVGFADRQACGRLFAQSDRQGTRAGQFSVNPVPNHTMIGATRLSSRRHCFRLSHNELGLLGNGKQPCHSFVSPG